ncbi:QueT transporter family protein [Methanoregula sp.]|uniref:QueT transporter family protein n=1 Tax=Methanoregula sp. TaxID=2052170 RepID=UPI00261F8852|nr:QueT transporter family protein [Methanoregula sp.]MDD5142356.1 QueT transporter family protein [Methanoregula sp.]
MHELAAVWTDRNGRIWIGATALFYVLVLIPFNYPGIEIFGISLRPAAFMLVTLGILFGPAGAWGLGIGNIAGDFFGGSWSAMSIFGFLINLLIPYLSYRLFFHLMKGRAIRRDYRTIICFLATSLIVVSTCMVLLAACGSVFFDRPFISKLTSYLGNNLFWAMVVGPGFFWLVVDPVLRNNLVYGREWAVREGESRS